MTGETTIPEKKVAVASYVNHEDYMYPSNDITVIELAEELDLTVYIPACLAQTGDATAFDGEDKNRASGFTYTYVYVFSLEFKKCLISKSSSFSIYNPPRKSETRSKVHKRSKKFKNPESIVRCPLALEQGSRSMASQGAKLWPFKGS